MFSSSPLISASLSMQWFFNGQTWQKMFGLSVRGLPSNKHVHLKCLLNQGSKTPEPPQTQQTTVESDCYSCKSSTSPPQNLWWPIVFITFGSFYFIYKCFFSRSPLHVFHIYKMYNRFSKTPPKTPVNGSHASHPSHGWMGPLDFPHWTWRKIAGDEGPKIWWSPYLCKHISCAV